ncbi:hypothetical protein JRO89_XS14G0029800 [Xanthoceras sorbifolium]|uniref:Uncharacterized protein n=1 Tax=Xanthoceras sorbifolium TaxID=99658 RepID=A0ABQ8H3I3_9ROSI|nr:hypothetical protein JRO89_XS14G0029800 [Xanthoceras sorbifolium]
MNWQRFISVPVFAVFLVTGFVYYITVLVFIRDWVGLQTSTGFWNALIFTLLLCLCLFSFFVSVLTDPGHVPPSYVPDVEDSVGSDQELKKPVSSMLIYVVLVLKEKLSASVSCASEKMRQVLYIQTSKGSSLQGLQKVCVKNGPSLSVDKQLCWLLELQGFLYARILCNNRKCLLYSYYNKLCVSKGLGFQRKGSTEAFLCKLEIHHLQLFYRMQP